MSSGERGFSDGGRAGETEPAAAAPDAEGDLRMRVARSRRALQRKAAQREAQPGGVQVPESGGAPLGPQLQQRMEGQLGADLSEVKVHTGSDSARAAGQLGARAFTDGNAVHFNSGEFAPGSKEGDRLLAHELTHVVQGERSGLQRKADQAELGGAEVSQPGDASELEADSVADHVTDRLHGGGGRESQPAIGASPSASPSAIRRKSDEAGGAAAIKKGANGILNADATVKLGDKETPLKQGTVIKVKWVEGAQLHVTVLSGHDGQVAEIPASLFHAEPGVDNDEDTGKPRDDEYQEYEGALWGEGGPTVADVAQGYIGDCFLMAGMGAVVAQDPGAIKALFNPQTPGAKSYTVTLYKKGKDKKFQPVGIPVDTELPTQKGSDHDPAYANNGKDAKTAALWPALLEKAYATMLGGYAAAGEGGMPGDAMQALTGVESGNQDIPDEKSTIEQFKTFEKEGKAVVAGTIGEMEADKKHPFEGADGSYSAKLQTNEGLEAEVAQETLEIADTKSKHHTNAKDDGHGKVKGPDLASGSVEYGSGAVELKFKEGKSPDKPKNLEASYQYRGMISKDLKLYADHSYMFESVAGDKLIFKNPWGTSHPNPVPAAEFVKLFDVLDTNQPKKPDAGK